MARTYIVLRIVAVIFLAIGVLLITASLDILPSKGTSIVMLISLIVGMPIADHIPRPRHSVPS